MPENMLKKCEQKTKLYQIHLLDMGIWKKYDKEQKKKELLKLKLKIEIIFSGVFKVDMMMSEKRRWFCISSLI
jgi:hypothetical protein